MQFSIAVIYNLACVQTLAPTLAFPHIFSKDIRDKMVRALHTQCLSVEPRNMERCRIFIVYRKQQMHLRKAIKKHKKQIILVSGPSTHEFFFIIFHRPVQCAIRHTSFLSHIYIISIVIVPFLSIVYLKQLNEPSCFRYFTVYSVKAKYIMRSIGTGCNQEIQINPLKQHKWM